MLYRKPYDTQIYRAGESLLADELESLVAHSGVILGLFETADLKDFRIWMKLLSSEEINPLRVCVSESLWRDRDSYFAGSELARLVMGHPRFELTPSGGEVNRAYAAVYLNQKPQILMVGPPTEEAWDEFLGSLSVAKSSGSRQL